MEAAQADLKYKQVEDFLLQTRNSGLNLPHLFSGIPHSLKLSLLRHSKHVAEYARNIGELVGLDGEELLRLEMAAMLHDIGKTRIPVEVLLKRKSLTLEERALVCVHPILGEVIVSSVKPLEPVAAIVRQHHERPDGLGYPDHLRGDEIDKSARIIAVADSYDAMRSDRPYRKAVSQEQVVGELLKGRNKQFDRSAVDTFLSFLERQKRKLLGLLPFRWFGRLKDQLLAASLTLPANCQAVMAAVVSTSMMLTVAAGVASYTPAASEVERAGRSAKTQVTGEYIASEPNPSAETQLLGEENQPPQSLTEGTTGLSEDSSSSAGVESGKSGLERGKKLGQGGVEAGVGGSKSQTKKSVKHPPSSDASHDGKADKKSSKDAKSNSPGNGKGRQSNNHPPKKDQAEKAKKEESSKNPESQ